METTDDAAFEDTYRHPVEAELDTPEEQAHALLLDLRESFAPSYLTLISIIEGVLLGLVFELLSEGRPLFHAGGPAVLLVINNVLLIALVWNEYRMGSSMFRWVPSLLDAVIPFAVGGLQAALILSVDQPLVWLGLLATFYLAGIVAFENMYRRSSEEARNAFVLERNRAFRRLNVLASVGLSCALWILLAVHLVWHTVPGWGTLLPVTALNLMFLIRGEANWQIIVAAARRLGDPRTAGGSRPAGHAGGALHMGVPVGRIDQP